MKAFHKGAAIFREGDPGDCMYMVESGKVGVYVGSDIKVFGEMGLLEHTERSATAAAMEANTRVTPVAEDNFGEFIRNYPVETLLIMQQMSGNLRRTSREFAEVCREIQALSEQEGTK